MAVSVDTSFDEDYDGFEFFREDYPFLLWGRWAREYQKADEKVWRKCFRARLLCKMNSLDDDDPANDTGGMSSLAISLFHAGDRRNAAAILSVLFKPLEDARASKRAAGPGGIEDQVNEAAGTEPANNGEECQASEEAISRTAKGEATRSPVAPKKPAQIGRSLSLNVTGRGYNVLFDNCKRQASQVAEMYYCEICNDINWCGDCLPLVKDRSLVPGLKEHMCNSNHTFYRA